MAGHPTRGVRVDQIRAELEGSAESPAGLLLEVEHEIEAGRAHRDIERACRKTGQVELAQRIVEQGEHGLEDRSARQVPLRDDVLDDLLEWHVLMVVRLERRLPDATEELVERRIAGEIDPQRQRVHEEANQPIELGLAADSRRGSPRRRRPVR